MPQAGDTIRALDFPPTLEVENADDQTNIANTAYAPGTPELGVTFIAPTSGMVEVSVYGQFRSDAEGSDVLLSFEVYEGSDATGTLRKPSSDNTAARTEGTSIQSHVGFDTVTGLTAGATHYARTVQKVFANTGDIFHRRLKVRPAT